MGFEVVEVGEEAVKDGMEIVCGCAMAWNLTGILWLFLLGQNFNVDIRSFILHSSKMRIVSTRSYQYIEVVLL